MRMAGRILTTADEFPIFDQSRQRPNELALVDQGGRMTWQEVADRTNRTAQALLEHGFRDGTRLAVLGTNCGATLLTYAAAVIAGVGAVLVNYHSAVDEVEYVLRDAGASALWASAECVATAREAARRARVPVLSDEGPEWWVSLVATRTGSPPHLDLRAATDLIYTSGTTGRPKGVELPASPAPTVRHRLEIATHHHMTGLGPHLVAGPLYHAGPHAAVGLLLTGHPVVLVGRFDPATVLTSIDTHRIGTTLMVPTHLIRLLSLPEARRRAADVSSLHMVALTGSSCPVPVMEAMIDWFGPIFREAYGASESGIIAFITSDDWLLHPGSVGRVQAPFRAKVLDESGSQCPPGQDGQLYFQDATGRGIRYHNDPDKTGAAHISAGTFTLGDVGHLDEDGYLYITGRVTDMVISGGVNIYPAECERVLSAHPSVRDVALFGLPDAEMGERLVGLVATTDDRIAPDSLIEACRQQIAGYKVPTKLIRVPNIPRSPMGKIDKGAARRTFLGLERSTVR
jgi:long-chain acyl-CoA synthetase